MLNKFNEIYIFDNFKNNFLTLDNILLFYKIHIYGIAILRKEGFNNIYIHRVFYVLIMNIQYFYFF